MIEAFYYSFLLSLSIIVALCIVDERLAYFIWLQFQIARITIAKWYFMVKFYPRFWLSGWLMKRRLAKLTEELQNELIHNKEQ